MQLEETELKLISAQDKIVTQLKRFSNNTYGTLVHFILLPVPVGKTYNLEITVKTSGGIIFHQKGKCRHTAWSNKCVISDDTPLIMEVDVNPFFRVVNTEKSVTRLLDKQKKIIDQVEKFDSTVEKKINAWFFNLIQRILKP